MPRKLFLSSVLGFASMSFGWFGLLAWQAGAPTYVSAWLSGLYERKEAAIARTPGPTLLLVGGSNVLFGLSAREIQARSGFHAVNFGTHGGLGLGYLLHRVQRVARRGDVILAPLEYELYVDEGKPTPLMADLIAGGDLEYWRSLPFSRQLSFALGLPTERVLSGIHNRLRPIPPFPANYLETVINAEGDAIANDPATLTSAQRRAVDQMPPNEALRSGVPTPHAIEVLRGFAAWCRRNGVRFLATYPNAMDFAVYHPTERLSMLSALVALYDELGVPLLGQPRDFLLPRGAFYDTTYHLTRTAQREHTRQLLPLLKPYRPELEAALSPVRGVGLVQNK